LGEYIGSIHTLVQKRPLVVESERINFEYGPGEPAECDPQPALELAQALNAREPGPVLNPAR